MSDHRVHGVDRTIRTGADRAAKRPPERRRDDRIDRVLGHRLDDGSGDGGCIELVRIATDERRERGAGTVEIVGFEPRPHILGLGAQHAAGRRETHHRGRGSRDDAGAGTEGDPGRRVRESRRPRVLVERAFHGRHRTTEDGDRMHACRRLTDESIECEPRGRAEQAAGTHHRAPATSRPTVSATTIAAPSTSPV